MIVRWHLGTYPCPWGWAAEGLWNAQMLNILRFYVNDEIHQISVDIVYWTDLDCMDFQEKIIFTWGMKYNMDLSNHKL